MTRFTSSVLLKSFPPHPHAPPIRPSCQKGRREIEAFSDSPYDFSSCNSTQCCLVMMAFVMSCPTIVTGICVMHCAIAVCTKQTHAIHITAAILIADWRGIWHHYPVCPSVMRKRHIRRTSCHDRCQSQHCRYFCYTFPHIDYLRSESAYTKISPSTPHIHPN